MEGRARPAEGKAPSPSEIKSKSMLDARKNTAEPVLSKASASPSTQPRAMPGSSTIPGKTGAKSKHARSDSEVMSEWESVTGHDEAQEEETANLSEKGPLPMLMYVLPAG